MSNIFANKLRTIGAITSEEAVSALNLSEREGIPFAVALENIGGKKEAEIINTISTNFSVQKDMFPEKTMDKALAERLPLRFSQQFNIVPYREEDGNIYVAVVDPFNRKILENARVQLQSQNRLIPVIVTYDSIRSMLGSLIDNDDEGTVESFLTGDIDVSSNDIDEINISNRVDSAPLVRLVDSLIIEAYRKGVSDIHIEPEDKVTNVRFRVDGSLFTFRTLDKSIHQMMTSRIKIMAGIDPSNRNKPHDGSFRFKSEYVTVDLRVSVIPTSNGEKVVMRLLGADKNVTYDLYSLGLNDYVIDTIEKTIRLPNGIFLVTGPTGSGKTTTLYSILHRLATPDTSVVTVEDPVERNMPGITQVQINDKAGLTFADSLRSILRQDPDTIMIGEMRDGETAEIATRAAITGHFVLSTIHTNDAISTIPRLMDMGVEPFMVASSLKCVIAQRLVKKNCENCKSEHINTQNEKELIDFDDEISYQGTGCEQCNFTGYSGRTAVFEILLIDKELQKLISSGATMDEMKIHVANLKIRTMRHEVLELVESGVTSIDEAIKILYSTD